MDNITVLDGLKGKNPAEKVKYGGTIKTGATDNAYFSDAGTKLTNLNDATDALKEANAMGDVAAINIKEAEFDIAVKIFVNYVQGKIIGVEALLAIAMVESANLSVKSKGVKRIKDFSAKKGKEINSVKLRRKAYVSKNNICYIWFMSLDGINFNFIMASTVATVIVSDLIPDTKYYYKVAVVEVAVQFAFSAVISYKN